MRFTSFGGTSGGCGCCGFSCTTCFPKTNLTLSYTSTLHGNGSKPLTYAHVGAGHDNWQMGCRNICLPSNCFVTADLDCNNGAIGFNVSTWGDTLCSSILIGTCTYASGGFTIASVTCSPFSITFIPTALCGTLTGIPAWQSWTITP